MPKGFHFSRRRYSAPTAFYFRSSVTRRFSVGNWFSFAFFLIFSFTALDLSAQVNEAWVARYDGPGNSIDQANALAVDDSGNVYVTGWSTDSVNSDDYATIKYKPNGDTLWVRRYDGPENSEDRASALAVDNNGNVYVTGVSYSTGSFEDYATIKYKPNGDTLWVRRYNGPGNNFDQASALAVDTNGNVYVTGNSYSSGSAYDYATIKYNSFGDTLWVRLYNGPGNDYDQAKALAVDNSGNVSVTGWSYGSGGYLDYATIKYKPNGDTAWVRRYNGLGNGYDYANALAADDYGMVYVTGRNYNGGSDDDYTTIKYRPNGDTGWVRHYNGPGNYVDHANAVAVDANSNVYVTGYSNDAGFNPDYATVKYSYSGDILWVRRYDGPGSGEDNPLALAVDDSGNVYVTGNSTDSAGFYDYATIKYAPNGDTLWVRRYAGPGNDNDYANALAVDNSGNAYVTGISWGETSEDYATIKYSPTAAAKGDMNSDGSLTAADAVLMVNCVYLGTGACILSIADVNCSGGLTAADAVIELQAVYLATPFPC